MTEFFYSCTTNERKREIGKCVTGKAPQPLKQLLCFFFFTERRFPISFGFVFKFTFPVHFGVKLPLFPGLLHSFLSLPASLAHFLLPAEELLNNFAQQNGAWRHCLFFLSNTRNEYVMMYSLTVFEVSRARGRVNVYLSFF